MGRIRLYSIILTPSIVTKYLFKQSASGLVDIKGVTFITDYDFETLIRVEKLYNGWRVDFPGRDVEVFVPKDESLGLEIDIRGTLEVSTESTDEL